MIFIVHHKQCEESNLSIASSTLGVNDILTFARRKLKIDDYFPAFKSASKVPDKVWLLYVGK